MRKFRAWLTAAFVALPLLAFAGTIVKSEVKFTAPNADQILFWDDSANDLKLLELGTNLSISGTTLNATGGTSYTDEQAQDAVGGTLTDSSELDFTYNDAAATITAALKTGIDPAKLGAGLVSSTEFGYLDGVTSSIQTQLNSKGTFTLPSLISGSVLYSDGSTIAQSNSNLFWDTVAGRLDVFGGLDSNKVINGTFTGGSSSWTVNSGWTYSSNAIHHSSNGTGVLTQNPSVVAGELYTLTLDASNFTAGSFTITVGGQTVATISANGSYSYRVPASNTSALTFTPTNTSRFTIDNIVLRKLQSGQIAMDSFGVGGANYAPSTTKGMITFSHSNGSPGTTQVLTFNNLGSNTWFNFVHGGVSKAYIGTDSGGSLSLWGSGGNYISCYNKNTFSLYCYMTPDVFAYYGRGQFTGKLMAGSSATPHSTVQSAGSLATKVKRITANQVLDDSATKWLCDASSAACSGSPSTACASHGSESACNANDAHGGCSWYAGSSCSAYNGDYSNCTSTSGCSWDTADCAGLGAYDESSCVSYSGCSWSNTGGDCSGFDESTCSMTSGCGVNRDYCTSYSDGGGDGTACGGVSGYGCSYDSGSGSCSDGVGDSGWFTSCSGSYDSYSCSGTYGTGNCSGTYGAACSGTASCAGIDDSGSCASETGCSYVTVLTAGLPPISTVEDRDYFVVNDSSSGADCVLDPDGSETIDGASSYTLSAYKDWAHISPFIKSQSCSVFDGNEGSCSGATGCTPQYSSCSWNSGDSTCSGHASCTGYTDQSGCEAATFYSGCGGTNIISKNWYLFGR